MSDKQIMKCLFVLVLFLSMKPVPAEDFWQTDPFVGDYQGTWTSGSMQGLPLCGQVIAQGGDAWVLNLLPAFDVREPLFASLKGTKQGSGIEFSGPAADHVEEAVTFTASLEGDVLTGSFDATEPGSFELTRTVRLSPTLNAPPPEGALVLFRGDSRDAWEKVGDDPRIVNLSREVGGEGCVVYLKSAVWSPVPFTGSLEVGSDDGVKVWINGALVHGVMQEREVTPGEDRVAVALQGGWNEVLVKSIQLKGTWGVALRITDETGVSPADLRVAPAGAESLADAGANGLSLATSEGYVNEWNISGPYRLEETGGASLFDHPFQPESGGSPSWMPLPARQKTSDPCPWLLTGDGAMEVHGGGIVTKRLFGDHQLHLEFRTPFMPEAREQKRGNSGVYLQGRYEVQILDSYGLEGTSRECGGIYTIASPRVNMCAPPTQWQTYDITFAAPRFDASGKKIRDAEITVIHNGVTIHDKQPVAAPTRAHVNSFIREPGPLHLQDHGNPVQFRNIWVVEK